MKAVKDVLRETFGYDELRDFQKDVMKIIQTDDAIALSPTGSGKSLVFQLPPIAKDKTVIVVSPLIALMKDQVDDLKARGIPAEHTASIHSMKQLKKIYKKFKIGELRLLYISPERFITKAFQKVFSEFRATKQLLFIAIDEAHTASIWARDFRPAYKMLADCIPSRTRLLLLTATADDYIVNDLKNMFDGREFETYSSSPIRDNIKLSVQREMTFRDVIHTIADFQDTFPEDVFLIYCHARNKAEEMADILKQSGYAAEHYHAGLNKKKRKSVQEQYKEGRIRILCATNAFGMGIDIPNIRLVLHLTLPDSLPAYLQEVGRCGRDGKESFGILNHSTDGEDLQTYFIGMQNPPMWVYEKAWEELKYTPKDVVQKIDVSLFAKKVDIRNFKLLAPALYYMEYKGMIRFGSIMNIVSCKILDENVLLELEEAGFRPQVTGKRMSLTTFESEENPIFRFMYEGRVKDIKSRQLFNIYRTEDYMTITDSELAAKFDLAESRLNKLIEYCELKDEAERTKLIEDSFLLR